jgi:16S rRNA (adenine1518-N6/adenine1519-N6)-dimethyltransferase
VALAELGPGDKVLEIGPGLGPLTECLLAGAGEVLAIEKDARLVEALRLRFGSGSVLPNAAALSLLHDDALRFLQREPRDWREWKMVSNLPYSVASPILVELAETGTGPERIVATLQIEVARRLMAKASDPDYGVLSLLVQRDYEPRSSFRIPASCFFPEPDVASACVCLVRRPEPLVEPAQRATFKRLVKRSFSQRRKMMLKLLRQDWPGDLLEEAFHELGISPQIRAEAISLEIFARLTRWLHARTPGL